MVNFPPKIVRHHIDTQVDDRGIFTARFHYFESPAPHAITISMSKLGLAVRCIDFDGQQKFLTIRFQKSQKQE